MSVKMIAVDMDGTFLNSYSDYNRNRFVQLYQKMKKNIRFVVESGNQYFQLKSFFPDIAAFGDSGNDYEMLSHVGYSFAMGNAADKIKSVAKQTILTNDQDCVLTTIEKLT